LKSREIPGRQAVGIPGEAVGFSLKLLALQKLENTHLDAEGVSHQIWKRSSNPHFPEAEPLVQSPCVSRERNLNEND